jgi:peroxiredoxin
MYSDMLKVGDKAPNFSLFSDMKIKITLDDYSGENLLILFFPMAFSGNCTQEMCAVRDDMSRYNKAKIKVLGISVNSVFTLSQFKKLNGINFDLLSDYNKETCRAYGAIYEEFVFEMIGVAKRSAFIVNRIGEIEYVEVLEKASDLPNFIEINKRIDTLK